MRQQEYDMQHRNYYLDHPTSVNHNQPYITSLQNQYSILNRARNPYQVLDHVNYQLKAKQHQNSAYRKSNKSDLANQSLVQEVREWSKRQIQKENSFRNLKDEMSDLSKIIKVKEAQAQLDKLRAQLRSDSHRGSIIPYPMIMPSFGAMGFQLPGGNCCGCSCSCKCQGHQYRQTTPIHKYYNPIRTEDQFQVNSNQKISLNQSKSNLSNPTSQHRFSLMINSAKRQSKIVQPRSIMHLQKKKKSNLLRRFRICAYAVYFSIYFKWFSFQFTVNRYNRFKENYLIDTGVKITDAYKQVYQRMLNINIPRLIRAAAKNVAWDKKKAEFDISTLIKAEAIIKLNSLSSYKILAKNKETLFLRCAQFIILMFKQLQSVFENWQHWSELGEALGVGTLNKTFLIDNYFLPHQIYLLVIHELKGYARIASAHQRSQAMVKFITKILIFNVCLQLDNNRQWLEKNQRLLEEQGDGTQIFVLLQISSKILFIISQFLYEQVLGDIQPNYDEVPQRFKVQPCNPLVYSHSIRKRRQLFKDENIKDSNLLIYGIQNLDEVNKIMKQEFFKSSSTKITNAIKTFVDLVLDKLKAKNREVYKQVWEQTLDDEYIVLRGLKKVMVHSRFFPFNSESATTKQNVKTDLSEYQSNVGSKKNMKIKRSNKNDSKRDILNSRTNIAQTKFKSNQQHTQY